MKIKKIYIFTSEPFPMGMAATNRIISYAKGFIFNEREVEIICFRKTDDKKNIKNVKTKGVYEGIKFRYLTRNTIKSKLFFLKRVDDIYGYINLFAFSILNLNSSSLSIYYSHHTVPAFILFIVNLAKGGVLLKEENEYPRLRLRSKNLVERALFLRLHYHLFNGYLLITNALVEYFSKEISKTKPKLHVPMMVDFERFDKKRLIKTKRKEIVYCGILSAKKDGVDILIRAFKDLSDRDLEFTLSLYGQARSEKSLNKFLLLVKELDLEQKVSFYGQINRDELTEKILDATVLAFPRPDSIQARNGFSTKLGEYLATGNPVIATNVGEISNYLTDNENIFLTKPGDVSSYSEKLISVINNYEAAKKVAKNGQDFARIHFNNFKQSQMVISFVESNF